MQDHLSRIEGDLEVIKQAIGVERPAGPDSPVPHLLLAASGIPCLLIAWALEAMGNVVHPLAAALIIGVPPLLAMTLWGRLKARDPAHVKRPAALVKSRREFWWQMIGSAALVGILMASGLPLISGPVILSLLVVLVIGLLNRPIVDHVEFSSLGWCVGIGLLAAWMIFQWPVPFAQGAVVGLTLVIGGVLAAAIAYATGHRSRS